jgi:transposase
VEGSFDQNSFAQFIDGLLDQMNPFPAKNSVIVMDNCRVHHADFILQMILDRYAFIFISIQTFLSNLSRGMKYVFLPAYSPDFNPIELAFSAIKAKLRQNGSLFRAASMTAEETLDAIYCLHEVVWSVTAEDARGWYHHCNYI